MEKFLYTNDLCDIWRVQNPDRRRYTWRQRKPSISSRLDMWFISDILQGYCTNTDIVPSVRSDHSSVTLSLRAIENIRGKGYWKLNSTLLDERDYVNGIRQEYPLWIKEADTFENEMMAWEYVKYKVRDFSILYSKKKARAISNELKEQEKILKELDEAIDVEEEEDIIHALELEKAATEAKLRSIDDYKTEGLILRSRCRWYEKGEKSNSYFLRLVNRQNVKTTMNKLKKKRGYTYRSETNI